MSAIAHFFSEDVSWICLASNMLIRYSLVLNPFANEVFVQFNVLSRSGGHVVQPPDAGFIVIVKKSRFINISNSKARIINTPTNILEVHNLHRHSAGCMDFCLTRTEGGAFLVIAKPTKRTTVLEDDTAAHTPEFEEREESSVGHCATNLQAPACITVGGESIQVVDCWRSGVSVCFDICGGRIVDE